MGAGVVIEAHYDHRKELSSITGEDTNWEGKFDYVWKDLASFPDNMEGGHPR